MICQSERERESESERESERERERERERVLGAGNLPSRVGDSDVSQDPSNLKTLKNKSYKKLFYVILSFGSKNK